MRMLRDLWFRLRATVSPGTLERELDEEMRFHLAMDAAKRQERGLPKDEAEQQAHTAFGDVERQKQRARDAWGISLIHDLRADTRVAFRQLLRQPALTATAVFTLALGIGGTVGLWSVVQGMLLQPLPYSDEAALVQFWADGDWMGIEVDVVRDSQRGFSSIAAFTTDVAAMRSDEETSLLPHTVASGELFEVLGATPLLGRTFDAADDRPGSPPVAVVSHALWQQRFGGDAEVLGKRLWIGGTQTTIVGVMPPGFYFPYPSQRAWLPLRMDPSSDDYAGNGFLSLVGRAADGVTDAQLSDAVTAIGRALGERFDYPDAWDKERGAHVTPLRTILLGPIRPALLLLLGAIGLLLAMACANVAALLLTRTIDRGGEMALRTALGAGRGRLVRQLVTETLLLGLVAGVLGFVVATALFDVLVTSLPLENGFAETLSVDWRTFAAALALAVLTALLVSAAPIRGLIGDRGRGSNTVLRSARSTQAGSHRLQSALVMTEAILAVTLVIGATLLFRSVSGLQSIDPGFDGEGVLAFDLIVDENTLDTAARRQFFARVAETVATVPGVRTAALTNRLALRDGGFQGPVRIEGRPDLEGDRAPNSYWRTATPDYFETMDIALLDGRTFEDRDRTGGAQVAIVSEGFARRMWPGESPIGRRLHTNVADDRELATVIGVVEEVRVTALVGENPMVLYRPQDQRRWPGAGNTLVLASDLDASVLVPAVRDAVRALEPRAVLTDATALDTVIADAMRAPLRMRFFLTLFAAAGIALGAVGIYGLVAYSVDRRRGEIGIRMAMGAAPHVLRRDVLLRGLAPVVAGTAIGATASLAAGRLLRSFLHGVAPNDPASIAFAVAVLAVTAVAAVLVPAYRAGTVDPRRLLDRA